MIKLLSSVSHVSEILWQLNLESSIVTHVITYSLLFYLWVLITTSQHIFRASMSRWPHRSMFRVSLMLSCSGWAPNHDVITSSWIFHTTAVSPLHHTLLHSCLHLAKNLLIEAAKIIALLLTTASWLTCKWAWMSSFIGYLQVRHALSHDVILHMG